MAQLVYSSGLSEIPYAAGSMMIEVVVCRRLPQSALLLKRLHQPFFHILASSIAQQIGEDKPHEIIATTIVAFALSSVLAGAPDQ